MLLKSGEFGLLSGSPGGTSHWYVTALTRDDKKTPYNR